jgi:hypothetical protein
MQNCGFSKIRDWSESKGGGGWAIKNRGGSSIFQPQGVGQEKLNNSLGVGHEKICFFLEILNKPKKNKKRKTCYNLKYSNVIDYGIITFLGWVDIF